jgi:lysophospholipid acyltransferase (LPLAT)-like uncharacterized protein
MPALSNLLRYGAVLVLYAWSRTIRVQAIPGTHPCVLTLWHQDLFSSMLAFRKKKIGVLMSSSPDGRLAAQLAIWHGYTVFYGSSSKQSGALRHLLTHLQRHPVGMALDGPRGPKFVAKPGASWLGTKAQVPLYHIHIQYTKCITLGSWDNAQIPLPFSSIQVSLQPCTTTFPSQINHRSSSHESTSPIYSL